MALSIRKLVDDASELVSLPQVVAQINKMVDSDEYTAADIGKVLSQDAALANRLLKIANSPMYGGLRQIDSINQAVVVLGTKLIRDLVFAAAATRMFTRIHSDAIAIEDFWRHSLYCGLLAHSLGTVSGQVSPDTLFTAGLLHDIGQMVVLNGVAGETAASILLGVQGEEQITLPEAEYRILGFDHAQVGAALAELWHLPEILTECIAFHHDPQAALSYPEAVAHVAVANRIASLPYDEASDEQFLESIDENWLKMTGLGRERLQGCINEARARLDESRAMLFG